MILQRLDDLRLDLLAAGGRAEGPIATMPSRPTGDLGGLLNRQAAQAPAVELHQPGEGDMAQVHVEAHADGVGGYQEVDLAGFVKRDLGVAGSRRE